MHANLKHYVERVRAITSQPLSPKTTVLRVQAAAEELLARGFTLPAEQRAVPADGHGRHLLHLEPGGFAVIAMAWPAGADSRPHDHGTWGVVGVLEGELRVTDYERQDDGSDPRGARLEPTGVATVGPGAVAHVLPPHDQFHRLENPGDGLSISLHTYGHELANCTVFDLATGATELVTPVYTSAPARAAAR